jgi:hypothetical protein
MSQRIALNIIGDNITFHTKLREYESYNPPFNLNCNIDMQRNKILNNCTIVGEPSMINHKPNFITFRYPHIITLIVINKKNY